MLQIGIVKILMIRIKMTFGVFDCFMLQIGIVRNISMWTARHPGFFHGHFAYIDFAR